MSDRSSRAGSWIAALTIAVSLAPAANVAAAEPVKLRFDPRTTLKVVARRMDITLRPEIPLPEIRLASATPLGRFQDAVEGQWGARPERIANAFVSNTNEIYLIDDASYYAGVGRTIDDSLAHELAHYLQTRYGRANLVDWEEVEAVAIQNWFRAEHVQVKLVDAGR
jgi:hypothetical protein